MGKETSYKLRRRVTPPDSHIGRKAVQLGLITEDQLNEALDHMAVDPAVPEQPVPATLSDSLVVCNILSQQQVDALVEGPPMPERLGRYGIGRKLGRGGMGVVYEAEDRDLGRRVALKMLRVTSDADPAETAEDEERFIREARISAKLPKHPHIVSVYEAGIQAGRRYIAMELIDGVQFQDWRTRKTTPLRLKISVLRDVALAVDHAHRHGVIHRDLKPANILVDAQNVPHVTDFGLAKQITRDQGGSLTGSGFLLGTPSYVSPEQAQGAKNVDCRTDVWSMGIMLYEVLTGRLPFQGMNALDIVIKTIRDPISPPSTTRRTTLASADRALETICMRALCKDPSDRYATAAAMAEDLTRWLEGRRVLATPPRMPKRIWKIGVAVAAVLSLVVVAVLKLSAPDESELRAQRVSEFVTQGRKHLAQNRPTEALIAFGNALDEDPKNKIAAAGKKEAHEKLIASAKPAAPPAKSAPAVPAPADASTPKPAAPAIDPDAPAGITELPSIQAHQNGVHVLAFSSEGKAMVTGSFDNTVRLWDFAARAPRKTLSEKALPISAAISRDGRWIAAGFLDSSLQLWDGDGAAQRSFPGHGLQVTGVAFSPDGGLLASSSTDGTARVWDRASGKQKSSMGGFPKGAMCLAMARDGKAAAVGTADRLIRLLDASTWEERSTFDQAHDTEVRCIAFSSDGQRIVSGGNDGKVVVTEVASGKKQLLGSHTQRVFGVAFSPDGHWIASASYDGTLRMWNGRTGASLGILRAAVPCLSVAFTPDGRIMAAGMGNGAVRLWNVNAVTAAK